MLDERVDFVTMLLAALEIFALATGHVGIFSVKYELLNAFPYLTRRLHRSEDIAMRAQRRAFIQH